MINNYKIVSIISYQDSINSARMLINLASTLNLCKKNILLIDLDPKCNLSNITKKQSGQCCDGVYKLLYNKLCIQNVIKKTLIPKIDIVLSNSGSQIFNTKSPRTQNRDFALCNALKKNNEFLQKYHYIFLHCVSSLNLLTINALTASDSVLIPMECESIAFNNILNSVNITNYVKLHLNIKLIIDGILIIMFDKKSRICQELVSDARNIFGNLIYDQVIPKNIKLTQYSLHVKPIMFQDSRCSTSISYFLLAQEILNKRK